MRKLTSLKKIEFVGIAVPSDETKEIVAMMCQIYSRACSFDLARDRATGHRTHCENTSSRPNATRVVFRLAYLV